MIPAPVRGDDPGVRAVSGPRITVIMLVGLAAAVFGRLLGPTTPVEIVSDGGRLEVTAAGSRLTADVAPVEVRRLAVSASDSVDPPGGGRLTVVTIGGLGSIQGAYLGAILITGRGNVPLNDRLAAVSATDPDAVPVWQHFLERWTRLNTVRTVASTLATVSFTIGLIEGGA